jgi:hypothetical protein
MYFFAGFAKAAVCFDSSGAAARDIWKNFPSTARSITDNACRNMPVTYIRHHGVNKRPDPR